MGPADHWWLAPGAVVSGVLFAWRELRAGSPLLDLRVFGGNRPLMLTYARTVLYYVVAYAYLYGFSQWLQEGRGLSPFVAGLVLLPLSGTALAISAITGRKAQVRGKLVVAAVGLCAACGLLLLLEPTSPMWLPLVATALMGIPQGLSSLGNQSALYYQADPDLIGASAGLLRTFGYLGAIVASAANAGFLGHRADTAGLHHLALFLLVVALIGLALTVLDRSLRRIEP